MWIEDNNPGCVHFGRAAHFVIEQVVNWLAQPLLAAGPGASACWRFEAAG
jgi:hypothetical protein